MAEFICSSSTIDNFVMRIAFANLERNTYEKIAGMTSLKVKSTRGVLRRDTSDDAPSKSLSLGLSLGRKRNGPYFAGDST